MKGPAHGAIVAGVSSTFAAGWIRHRTVEAYDPEIEPVPLETRLTQRAPMALAGLGFTGLSTTVAYSFDRIESMILGDSSVEQTIDLGTHHDLHNIPYVTTVVFAARLIRQAGDEFGNWIASKLDVPDRTSEVVDALDSLANWILSGAWTGSVGHMIGDIPTSANTLRLFSPITDRNFCMKWINHNNPVWNQYFTYGGIALSGAAWAVSGSYLCSWKPPEQKIGDYIDELRKCESFGDASALILQDIEDLFTDLLPDGESKLWNRPLFDSEHEQVHPDLDQHWFHQNIQTEEIFDIDSISGATSQTSPAVTSDIHSMRSNISLVSPDSPAVTHLENITGEDITSVEIIDRSNQWREGAVDIQTTDSTIDASIRADKPDDMQPLETGPTKDLEKRSLFEETQDEEADEQS